MTPPTIKAMVQAIPRSLGAYGPVLQEIEEALQSPQCSLNAMGDAIQKDPDLTARLLRLANSPFYGFASRLSTVAEAVGLVGIQQIQDMIVASSVLEQFKGVPDRFGEQGILLAAQSGRGHRPRGCWPWNAACPSRTSFLSPACCTTSGGWCCSRRRRNGRRQVFELYQRERILLRDAEKKILGYDHQQIAAELLQSWSYPAVLVQAVAFHHAPEGGIAQTDAAVVHVADHLVNAMGIGSSGEHFIPPLSEKAWAALGLGAGTARGHRGGRGRTDPRRGGGVFETRQRKREMNEHFDSVYPDFLRSGLEKLSRLDARSELPALFVALEHFRRDLHGQDSARGILKVSRRYIDGLKLFSKTGFWTVNAPDFSFELSPPAQSGRRRASCKRSWMGRSRPGALRLRCGRARRFFSARHGIRSRTTASCIRWPFPPRSWACSADCCGAKSRPPSKSPSASSPPCWA